MNHKILLRSLEVDSWFVKMVILMSGAADAHHGKGLSFFLLVGDST